MEARTARIVAESVRRLDRGLAADFPCPECSGTGQGNPESHPYPEPCPACWGRGHVIPTEEDH